MDKKVQKAVERRNHRRGPLDPIEKIISVVVGLITGGIIFTLGLIVGMIIY